MHVNYISKSKIRCNASSFFPFMIVKRRVGNGYGWVRLTSKDSRYVPNLNPTLVLIKLEMSKRTPNYRIGLDLVSNVHPSIAKEITRRR